MRGIFFDEDSVREVERLLRAQGYDVVLAREPFAGEDDDEDQPWSVTSDAPALVLELLVDQFDGWLEDGTVEAPGGQPLDLPDAPRRHHRPAP
ncbi:MAG: hypothetical protein JWR52_376 [Marmoricola sp.]|nr:hypothetical protein [Marmoricola sp.]